MRFGLKQAQGLAATLKPEIDAFTRELTSWSGNVRSRDVDEALIQLNFWNEAAANARIEGAEVAARDLAEASQSRYGDFSRSIRAAANSGRALSYVNSCFRPKHPGGERAADPGFARSLHYICMSDGLLEKESCGVWRDCPIDVVDHRTQRKANSGAPPEKIKDGMADWAEAFDAERWESRHPLIRSALAHLAFEEIHPFKDGNGRAGRVMIEAMHAEDGLPPLPLACVLERDRSAYHAQLTDAIASGDPTNWTRFHLTRCTESARVMRRSAARIQEQADAATEELGARTNLPLRERRTMAFKLMAFPVARPQMLSRLCGLEPPKIAAGLKSLEKAGVVERTQIRGKQVFINRNAFAIAEGMPSDERAPKPRDDARREPEL